MEDWLRGLAVKAETVVDVRADTPLLDPVAVLREADRLLTDRGVFAAYDCQWPVSISSLAEKAWISLFDSVWQLSEKYKYKLPLVKLCPKSRHLQNMENSKVFAYCRQIYFDTVESCTADRFIDMALSQGSLQMLLKHGIHEIDREFEKFCDTVRLDISKRKQMTVSYTMVLGQKLQSQQF